MSKNRTNTRIFIRFPPKKITRGTSLKVASPQSLKESPGDFVERPVGARSGGRGGCDVTYLPGLRRDLAASVPPGTIWSGGWQGHKGCGPMVGRSGWDGTAGSKWFLSGKGGGLGMWFFGQLGILQPERGGETTIWLGVQIRKSGIFGVTDGGY